MASKKTLRRFEKEREAHNALERVKEAERKKARLKGLKLASPSDMAAAVLGVKPGTTHAELAAEGVAANMNRAERRARRR